MQHFIGAHETINKLASKLISNSGKLVVLTFLQKKKGSSSSEKRKTYKNVRIISSFLENARGTDSAPH